MVTENGSKQLIRSGSKNTSSKLQFHQDANWSDIGALTCEADILYRYRPHSTIMNTNKSPLLRKSLIPGTLALLSQMAFGQGESLKTDLVSYWPLDEVQGNKTPDLASGFDFTLKNMDATDLIAGKFGMAFNFKKVNKAHLLRAHDAGDDLPAIKNPSFTLAYWTRTTGNGQSDLRLFSEGSDLNNDPLFTMGTRPAANTGPALDVFIRQSGTTLVNHVGTTAGPLDGLDWHHVAFVQTLQPDGTATRQVYIDGVLDPISLVNKEAGVTYNANNTAIGAVVRASDVAHVDGEVDEVAIWKRALTPAEITDLIANGMPDLADTQQDLVIREFIPEFRKTTTGSEVKLSWDATKDATLEIDQEVGDVTAIGTFGVGSTTVTITEPTTFTLTASRDGEPSVTETISVSPISGVASGWNWIEDFNDFSAGPLLAQGGWLAPAGSFVVQTIGDTQAIHQTDEADLTGRYLGTHGITEGSSRTLFFRFCASSLEADLPISLKVGLTEKGFRFANDWEENIGTYVIFSRVAGGPLQMQAINGIDGTPVDSGLTFEPDASYDVWIDVTNNTLDITDKFTAYVAPSGGSRSVVFDNYNSDRKPGEVFLLGFPRPDIDHIFAVANLEAGQASLAVALDDFYISPAGSFLSTAPVASGFGKGTIGAPEITSSGYDAASGMMSLEWNSRANIGYSVWASPGLTADSWFEYLDGIPSSGTQTSTSFAAPNGESSYFFQVREQ